MPPEPMLSTSGSKWPSGEGWALQPKWDGFRLLVEISRRGRVCAWTRHGSSISDRLPGLLAALAQLPPGTVLDGELVAIGQRDGHPVPDFAAVQRAVFHGDVAATRRLRFIAFDLCEFGGKSARGALAGSR